MVDRSLIKFAALARKRCLLVLEHHRTATCDIERTLIDAVLQFLHIFVVLQPFSVCRLTSAALDELVQITTQLLVVGTTSFPRSL